MASVTRQSLPSDWTTAVTWNGTSDTWANFGGSWWYVNTETTISIKGSLWKRVKKDFLRTINIVSRYSDNISFNFRFLESVGVSDKAGRECCINNKDTFGISDGEKITKVVDLVNIQPIKFTLDFTDTRCLIRDFTETISISSHFSKEPIINKYSHFNICDDLLRNCNAVIADILVSTGEIDESVPAGYGPWKPFVSGDYKYKDALIRAELNKGVLSQYTVFVDLPDIKDMGKSRVEARSTWIPFTQSFYNVPEVTITMFGSTSFVMPLVTEVKLDGFFVCLKDSGGNNVEGTIAWQALGC